MKSMKVGIDVEMLVGSQEPTRDGDFGKPYDGLRTVTTNDRILARGSYKMKKRDLSGEQLYWASC